MCGLDGTLIGLTPVFKEIWASEFMFGTKELVNNYVCCTVQIDILDLLL